MMQAQPLSIGCALKLQDAGIGPSAYSFASLQMQSDKYLCVKDVDKGQVVVFDIQNNFAKDTKPMKADTALMNPAKNWIALKGKLLVTPCSLYWPASAIMSADYMKYVKLFPRLDLLANQSMNQPGWRSIIDETVFIDDNR